MSDGLAVRRMLEQQIEALKRTAAVQLAALERSHSVHDAERGVAVEKQLDKTLERLDDLRSRLDALGE